jgi:hypothetical protein
VVFDFQIHLARESNSTLCKVKMAPKLVDLVFP